MTCCIVPPPTVGVATAATRSAQRAGGTSQPTVVGKSRSCPTGSGPPDPKRCSSWPLGALLATLNLMRQGIRQASSRAPKCRWGSLSPSPDRFVAADRCCRPLPACDVSPLPTPALRNRTPPIGRRSARERALPTARPSPPPRTKRQTHYHGRASDQLGGQLSPLGSKRGGDWRRRRGGAKVLRESVQPGRPLSMCKKPPPFAQSRYQNSKPRCSSRMMFFKDTVFDMLWRGMAAGWVL